MHCPACVADGNATPAPREHRAKNGGKPCSGQPAWAAAPSRTSSHPAASGLNFLLCVHLQHWPGLRSRAQCLQSTRGTGCHVLSPGHTWTPGHTAWPAGLLGRRGRGRPHSDPREGKWGGGRPAPWAAPWEPGPARRTGWPGRPRGSHFTQALEGGETEALGRRWTCGRTLPTARAELSVTLTEKLSGEKHTHSKLWLLPQTSHFQ